MEKLSLNTIRPENGATKTSKRVGRGLGSKGTYSGRGSKGQRARSGGKSGLQLKGIRSLMLSIPKARGFKSQSRKPETVNVGELSVFGKDQIVNPMSLKKRGLIKNPSLGVKILGNGVISESLKIRGCAVSSSAKIKIEAAKGTIEKE